MILARLNGVPGRPVAQRELRGRSRRVKIYSTTRRFGSAVPRGRPNAIRMSGGGNQSAAAAIRQGC